MTFDGFHLTIYLPWIHDRNVGTRTVIDYTQFVANSQPLPIIERRDTGIEFRRLLTLSHLSRALHQPRVSLPPGYTP